VHTVRSRKLQDHSRSQLGRRDSLKLPPRPPLPCGDELVRGAPGRGTDDDAPEDSGRRGRRYVIRGGHVMSMDRRSATSLMRRARRRQEDRRHRANLHAGDAAEIDARGKIVMPGFIDSTTTSSRRRCAASSLTGY